MQLKVFLNDCVDRGLIASSQMPILYKEYMQPRSFGAVALSDPIQPVAPQTTSSENMPKSVSKKDGKGMTAENTGTIPAARFCRNCGEKLDEDDRFCPRCGVRVTDAQATWTEYHSSESTVFDKAREEKGL